jgi:hypothetical protein
MAAPATLRGDLVIGAGDMPLVAPTPGAGLNAIVAGDHAEFVRPSGALASTLDWTTASAEPWVAVVAAFKPANAMSVVNLCPNAGVASLIAGASTAAAMCSGEGTLGVPLVPGASADLTVDGSGNYFAVLNSPATGVGVTEVAATAFTPNLESCYEVTSLRNNLAAITVTMPAGLPPGCTVALQQLGSQAALVQAGSGLDLHSNGNTHTGGIGTGSYLFSTNGGAAIFAGATAP